MELKEKFKSKIFFTIKIFLTIICLLIIYNFYDLDLEYFNKIKLEQIILSFFFLFFNLIFASYRIREIINEGLLMFYIKINWMSSFVSTFIPTPIGSEIVRGYLIKKELNYKLKKILSIILFDKAIGFLTLCFFAGFLLYYFDKEIFNFFIIFSLFIFILTIFFEKKISLKLKSFFNFNHKVILYSLLSNLFFILHIYILIDFNISKSLVFELFAIISLFIILNTISITPQGIGLTELAFLLLFNNYLSENKIIEIFLFSRLIYLSFALFGIFYFFKNRYVYKKRL